MSQPRMIGDTRLAGAAERAIGKLMASLPVTLRQQAASIRQRLYVDTTGWRGASENLVMLPIVQEAVSHDRKLKIQYQRPGSESVERVVDPARPRRQGQHLVSRRHTRQRAIAPIVSRASCRRSLLDESSERPPDFDLAAYWKSSSERFSEALPRYDALVRAEPRTAGWVQMSRPPWSVQVDDARGPDVDGWVTLRLRFDSEEEACSVVLGLGPRVDVIEPANLRERVLAEAASVVERGRVDSR